MIYLIICVYNAFFVSHLHIKRIQFLYMSSLYLWFPKSTELCVFFSLFAIQWFICPYFSTLKFLIFGKILGGGGGQLPHLPLCSYGHAVGLWRSDVCVLLVVLIKHITWLDHILLMVNQVLVRVGCNPTRPAMPAARGEESERMLCTCI